MVFWYSRREYSLRSWRSVASLPRLATPTAPLGGAVISGQLRELIILLYSFIVFYSIPARREYSLRSKLSSNPPEVAKNHPHGWLFWYSRRESNPQRPLRRGLLYPFNYGSLFFYYVLFDPRPAGILASLVAFGRFASSAKRPQRRP